MSQRVVAAFGMALLVLAVVLVARQTVREGAGDGAVVGNAKVDGAGRSKSRRGLQSKGRSLRPMQRLMQLVGADIENPPRFTEFEELVAFLSDEELEKLRQTTAEARADTLTAWLRCAVYAEMARRDPRAVFDLITSSSDFWDMPEWNLRQVWVSSFRGWAENDPAAALEAMQAYHEPSESSAEVPPSDIVHSLVDYIRRVRDDDIWRRQAYQAVFAGWATRGFEEAWAALPDPEFDELRESAIIGLVRGIDIEDLELLLPRIEEQASARIASMTYYSEESDIRITGIGRTPREETIAALIALRLAERDLDRATEWIRDTYGSSYTEGPHDTFVLFLAQQRPDQLMNLLGSDFVSDAFVISHLVRAHPERSSEFIEYLDTPEALQLAIYGSASLEVANLFPAADRRNRLPDYQQRYDGILEAIQQSGASFGKERMMHNQLNVEFSGVVRRIPLPTQQ